MGRSIAADDVDGGSPRFGAAKGSMESSRHVGRGGSKSYRTVVRDRWGHRPSGQSPACAVLVDDVRLTVRSFGTRHTITWLPLRDHSSQPVHSVPTRTPKSRGPRLAAFEEGGQLLLDAT